MGTMFRDLYLRAASLYSFSPLISYPALLSTPIKGGGQVSLSANTDNCRLVDVCRYWSVLVGIGRYWSVLVGIGRYWSVLVGIGRYWSVLVGIGWYWLVSVGRVGICRQRGLTTAL